MWVAPITIVWRKCQKRRYTTNDVTLTFSFSWQSVSDFACSAWASFCGRFPEFAACPIRDNSRFISAKFFEAWTIDLTETPNVCSFCFATPKLLNSRGSSTCCYQSFVRADVLKLEVATLLRVARIKMSCTDIYNKNEKMKSYCIILKLNPTSQKRNFALNKQDIL